MLNSDKKLRKTSGFSLIELMIVVAIVGILAAVALPQYKNYVMYSKWSDTLVSAATLKLAIAECIQTSMGATTGCTTAASLNLVSLPQAKYATAAFVVSAPTSSTVSIAVTGTSEVGGYNYVALGSVDSSATNITWSAGSGDNVPASIMKAGIR